MGVGGPGTPGESWAGSELGGKPVGAEGSERMVRE